MKALCTVTLNGPRGEFWERAIGTRTLPVLSVEPSLVRLGAAGFDAEAYILDVKALRGNMLADIALHLSQQEQSNYTATEILDEIERNGLAIRVGPDAVAVTQQGSLRFI